MKFVRRVGEREWFAMTGEEMKVPDDYTRTEVEVNGWFVGVMDLRTAIAVYMPSQSWEHCSLEYARNVLHEMGHEPSSLELLRLNGPRVYTI